MWTLDSRSAVPAWRSDTVPPGLRMGFSTRRGGVSHAPYDTLNLGRSTADDPAAVMENRSRLLAAFGLDPEQLATAGQVHGAGVLRADGPGLAGDGDALVTTRPGLALAVTAADCLPVLLAAPGGVAAIHAGWRGAAAGVAEAALRALTAAAGCDAGQVTAHFGPCIRDCCYEVGPEVAAQFPAAAVHRRAAPGRDDRAALHLSVPESVRRRLVEAGMSPEAIHDSGACTACDPEWYFSHRRDRGVTGRQWGVIARVLTDR